MHFNIMNEVVNESLRKICHYQQNLPQHCYVSDALVLNPDYVAARSLCSLGTLARRQ